MSRNLKILSCLAGNWELSRTIQHPTHKLLAQGKATLVKVDEYKLAYKEECTLFMQESDLTMTREYLYIYNKEKDQIEKYFVQNESPTYLFYVVNEKSQGFHMCLKDLYNAQYAFPESNSFNEFALTYTVEGPNKNYRSHTNYIRLI